MREKSPSPRARASILAPFPTHFRHQSKVKMATIVAQQLSAGCVGVSSPVSPSRASGRRDAPWRIDPISQGARTITRATSPRARDRPSSTSDARC